MKNIKILDGDKNSFRREQQIKLDLKLSTLRNKLNLNNNKVFCKDSCEIKIDNEDNLTIADIEREGTINIIEKSFEYSILVNNNVITTKLFSTTITAATLRTYLIVEIPKECNFLNTSKQTPIPIEMEKNI